MGKLTDWTREKSKFFKLGDGESMTVTFKGYDFAKSTFDPDKEVVRYTLDTSYGEKTWDTGSQKVATFFDKVKPGQEVVVTRRGTGRDTEYELSLVGE